MPALDPPADRPAASPATAAIPAGEVPAGDRFEFHEFDDDASLAAVNDGRGLAGPEWDNWLDQLQRRLLGERPEHWLAWTEHPGRRRIRERYVRRYFQRPEHSVAAHRGDGRRLWPLPHHDDDALDTLNLTDAEWDHYLSELSRALAAGRRSIEWLDDPSRARLKERYRAALAGARADMPGEASSDEPPGTGAAASTPTTRARSGPGRLGTGWRSPRQPNLATSPRTMRGGARAVTGAGRGLRRVINSSDPVEARKPPAATFNEGYRVQYIAAMREGARRWF